jgi:adenylylsulfate kinase
MTPPLSVNPCVIWFTGLSGAGKSTIGGAVMERLSAWTAVEFLDGDAVREVSPPGFTRPERDAHVRRVGFLASRLERHGVTSICSLISPYAESRDWVRQRCARFIEIHVSTPLVECERRDVKGLYALARQGRITQFTGIDDPYEPPSAPDLRIDTSVMSLHVAVQLVLETWASRAMTDAPVLHRVRWRTEAIDASKMELR